MKFVKGLLFFLFCFAVTAYAEDKPLRIGIGYFYPPFIMQGANNELYGFDIELVTELCKIMHRTCHFHVMKFKNLLPAITQKNIDIAINAISITPQRSKLVNFTNPYLLSYSRFLTSRNYADKPFSLKLLDGKRIGVDADSVFAQEISEMNIVNPTIVEFSGRHSTEDMLEALGEGKIDFVLTDNPSALYWAANTSGDVETIGSPILYGFGLGIAVPQDDIELLQSINSALLKYEFSDKYINNYNKYILHF